MTGSPNLRITECKHVPENPRYDTVYRLLPNNFDPAYYRERVDRNIGWITEEEQEMLKTCTVGIAGCGGMGGLLAERMLRLGVGEIRIADPEVFDISNINRQFGARRDTIGKSKAFVTAHMLRTISDDTTLVVYPQGITQGIVNHFLDGCDVVCDEIEFWIIGARTLLHKTARGLGISIFNCNTVGFGSRLFLFTPTSTPIEKMIGLSLEEAFVVEERMRSGKATAYQKKMLLDSLLNGLVPEFPRYQKNQKMDEVYNRLLEDGQASIIATNPPLATGLIANHILLYLLRNSTVQRTLSATPETPSYLYLDSAHMKAYHVARKRL